MLMLINTEFSDSEHAKTQNCVLRTCEIFLTMISNPLIVNDRAETNEHLCGM